MIEAAVLAVNSGVNVDKFAVKLVPLVRSAGINDVKQAVAIIKRIRSDPANRRRNADGFQIGAAVKSIFTQYGNGLRQEYTPQGSAACESIVFDGIERVGQDHRG